MLFLAPWLLWFATAAAVPIAIHLLNKRRHKTIPWAAMQFLLKATRESRGKKKLRQILILACRALALVALAFAAAKPVVSGLVGWGGKVEVVVLLLDRSASMEAKPGDGYDSRREIVLKKVRDTMRDLGSARLVLIDSASGTPQEVPSPDVLPELSATAPSDTAADLPALAAKAAEFLGETRGRAEIWIATDLQASNWRPTDDRWANVRASLAALPRKPAVRVLGLTGPTAANASLHLLAARRSGNDLLLDAEVSRGEDARGSVRLPLTLHFNGSRTTETLAFDGQSLRFQKRVPLPAGSDDGHGWLSLPADGNPRDNTEFFAYGPDRPVKSLVVAPPGEAADYLLLAAAPPGFGRQTATRLDPAQSAALPTAETAAILWAAPLPTGPAAAALESFLSGGGQVLFLPPGKASATAFLDMKWADSTEADPGKFFILKDWSHDDGLLRDGTDGSPLPAGRLKAIRRQLPLGEATPLARWDDGEPFLVRRVVDRGTAWFLGSLPDYAWSNLGDADVLLPLVQRTVTAGADRFDASYLAELGSDAARLSPGETRLRLDDFGTPDPANAAYDAGVYRLGDRVIALNRPVAEDFPEIVGHEAIEASLDGTGYTLFEQAGQTTNTALSRDVWRAFLAAMLFFLLAEALLCLPKRSTQTEEVPLKRTAS
jgi:hypothetical protein